MTDTNGRVRARYCTPNKGNRYIGRKGVLVQAYGLTTSDANDIGGTWGSLAQPGSSGAVRYKPGASTRRSAWPIADAAHSFQFASPGFGYRGGPADFCVFRLSRGGC